MHRALCLERQLVEDSLVERLVVLLLEGSAEEVIGERRTADEQLGEKGLFRAESQPKSTAGRKRVYLIRSETLARLVDVLEISRERTLNDL